MKPKWMFLLLGPALTLLYYGKSHAVHPIAFDPAAIDRFITIQMRVQGVPGLGLAITQGDQVLYVKGYGTDGNGRAVTPQTQFFVASVSKSFTALAVLQLVEAGKIQLDAPVQTYLPEFRLDDSTVASEITVRELLNHTSGLSELSFADMALPQPGSIEERVTSLHTAVPVAGPGTEYHYFSPNYGVLARLVEVVSGEPFSKYLKTHVFMPLAMDHSLNVVTSSEGTQKAEDVARGHLVLFGIPFSYPEAKGYVGGSGGVITTAEDMSHFLILQNNAGRYANQQLVSPESMELMHTPPSLIDTTYAMGWWTVNAVQGKQVLEHNGILSAFSADAVLLPDDQIGIAVLYNVSSFPTNTFGSSAIRNGLISILSGKEPQTSWMNVRVWGWIMGLLTLLGTYLAVRSLLLLPRWSQTAGTLPGWRILPGILWAFLPALALWGLPILTTKFADRVFGFVNFYKSMLDIFVWLAVTGLLGLINGTARIVILLQRWLR